MDVLLNRRAAQLDTALAGGADGLTVHREVVLVHRLHTVGMVTAPPPTEEFRAALRTRLMAVAAVQGVGDSAPAPAPSSVSWRSRLATLGAGVMAGVVAASGVAVASSRSLPGDPFYGVKRTTEDLQLRLADGAQAQGIRHLQFAATRLREVRGLVLGREASAVTTTPAVDADEQDDVRDALADMDEQTRTGVRLLTSAFRETRVSGPLEELRQFAARQGDGLRQMLPALGGPMLVQAQGSLTLLDGVRAEADELLMLVDCTSACDPSQTAPAPAGGGAAGGSPCSCPTKVPVPRTAPAPAPAAPAPAPAPAVQPSSSTGPTASRPPSEAPSAPPSQAPSPPSDDEPEPLPLPGPTLPVSPPLPLGEPPDTQLN